MRDTEMSIDIDTVELTLPSDLASLFINGDYTSLDYDNDEQYEESVHSFLAELNAEGLEIVDVVEDSEHFSKYHDMIDHGVSATTCSTFIAAGV